ncbi:zinc finger Y-chromosomal protein 2-like [Harmonia axyridis]|uniref:zinc finger Y-chromosomal protein 2-like n=1 Tax=Harmonia axyridis TaxID=115357 RepID=UPI001E276B67|nr:zinc finger Y-chromosomal protein 2-like [Harmonia axyridis]
MESIQHPIEDKTNISFSESIHVFKTEGSLETFKAEIENLDIVEEFIDESQIKVNNTGAFIIKIENEVDSNDTSEQSVPHAVQIMKENEEKESLETFKVKIEDLDIVEEFIDESQIHKEQAIITKIENEVDSNNTCEQSVPCAIQMREESEEKKNCLFNAKRVTSWKTIIASKQQDCHLCEFSSKNKYELNYHINTIHLKPFKCDICDYATNIKYSLRLHMESVHSSSSHKCHLCDFITTHKNYLKSHIDHVHINLKQYKCDFCDYASSRNHDIKKHINTVHSNDKPHKCHLCDFASNHKHYLKLHVKSVHLDLKLHKCGLCNYAGNSKYVIKRHVDSAHSNKKPHKCNLCEFASSHKSYLKIHIDGVHSDLKKYKCNLCDNSFKWKSSLKYHLDSVHFMSKEQMKSK